MYHPRRNTVPTPDDSSSLPCSSSSDASDEDDSYYSDTSAQPPPPPLNIGSSGRVSQMVQLFDRRAKETRPSPSKKSATWMNRVPTNHVHHRVKEYMDLSPEGNDRMTRKEERKHKRKQFINEYMKTGTEAREKAAHSNRQHHQYEGGLKELRRRKTFAALDSPRVKGRSSHRRISKIRNHDGSPDGSPEDDQASETDNGKVSVATGRRDVQDRYHTRGKASVSGKTARANEYTSLNAPPTTPSRPPHNRFAAVHHKPQLSISEDQMQTPRSKKPLLPGSPGSPRSPGSPGSPVREIPKRTYGTYAASAMKKLQTRTGQVFSDVNSALLSPHQAVDSLSKYAGRSDNPKRETIPHRPLGRSNSPAMESLTQSVYSPGMQSPQSSVLSRSPTLTAQLEDFEEISPVPGYSAPSSSHKIMDDPFLDPTYDPRPAPLFSSTNTSSNNTSRLQLPGADYVKRTVRAYKSTPFFNRSSDNKQEDYGSPKKMKVIQQQQKINDSSDDHVEGAHYKVPKRIISDTHWMKQKPQKPSNDQEVEIAASVPLPSTPSSHQSYSNPYNYQQQMVRKTPKHRDLRQRHRQDSESEQTSTHASSAPTSTDERDYTSDDTSRSRQLFNSDTFRERVRRPKWQEPLRRAATPTSEVSTENVTTLPATKQGSIRRPRPITRESTMISVSSDGRRANTDEFSSRKIDEGDVTIRLAEKVGKRLLSRSRSTGAFLAPEVRGKANPFVNDGWVPYL